MSQLQGILRDYHAYHSMGRLLAKLAAPQGRKGAATVSLLKGLVFFLDSLQSGGEDRYVRVVGC